MLKFLTIFLALSLIILAGCQRSEKQVAGKGEGEKVSTAGTQVEERGGEEKGEENRKIAALVNGRAIYEDEIRGGTVDKAIDRELLYQEALRRGIDKRVERDLERYKKNLILRIFNNELLSDSNKVDEAEILDYYDKHKPEFVQSITAMEIVSTKPKIAKEIYARIQAGEKFEDLLNEYVKKRKIAHQHFKVDPPYADQFAGKKVGAVIGPIERGGEYKVAKLMERYEEPFESAKHTIIRKLSREKSKAAEKKLLQKLRAESKIKILSKNDKTGEIKFTKSEFLKLAKGCLEMPNSFAKTNCLKPIFQTFSFNKSAKYALNLAHDLQQEGTIPDCHLVAHFIGRSELEKQNYNVEKAFSACAPVCMQGCYHGVLETYINYAKWKPEDVPLKASELCERIGKSPILKRQCIHGVGHGLIANNYLPLKEAIGVCRRFSDDTKINACLGGVFMEHMNGLLFHSEDELAQIVPNLCGDIDKMNDEGLSMKCAHAIGEGLMFYTGQNLKKSSEMCKMLGPKNQKSCVVAARDMLSDTHTH